MDNKPLSFFQINKSSFRKLAFVLLLSMAIHLCHRASMTEVRSLRYCNSLALIPTVSLSLGFEHLICDLEWLSFVQYFGACEIARERPTLAKEYLQRIIALDPTFIKPYYFAAFILGGEFNDGKEAAKIIEPGVTVNPDVWQLPYIAGFNAYIYGHDEERGAQFYELASQRLGAPPWLAGQAKTLRAHIPSLVKQLSALEALYLTCDDPLVKATARTQLYAVAHFIEHTSQSPMIKSRASEVLKKYR